VESWRQLHLCIRHRRDLVRKCSALACQIREHLDAALPGYVACFDKLWDIVRVCSQLLIAMAECCGKI